VRSRQVTLFVRGSGFSLIDRNFTVALRTPTYLHGLFASGPFLQTWLSGVGAEREVHIQVGWQEWQDEQDFQLDRLANALEEHLHMVTIRALGGIGDK